MQLCFVLRCTVLLADRPPHLAACCCIQRQSLGTASSKFSLGLPANRMHPQVLLEQCVKISAGMYVNAWSAQYAAFGKGVTLQHMLCTTQHLSQCRQVMH